jgi:hypothetical protein
MYASDDAVEEIRTTIFVCNECYEDNCNKCRFDYMNTMELVCLGCEGDSVMWEGKCVDECPKGTYANADKVCVACSEHCDECNAEGCLTCTPMQRVSPSGLKRTRQDGECLEHCADGHYRKNPCGDETECSDVCLPCSEGCHTCSSPDTCYKCDNANGWLWETVLTGGAYTGTCIKGCPEGWEVEF